MSIFRHVSDIPDMTITRTPKPNSKWLEFLCDFSYSVQVFELDNKKLTLINEDESKLSLQEMLRTGDEGMSPTFSVELCHYRKLLDILGLHWYAISNPWKQKAVDVILIRD